MPNDNVRSYLHLHLIVFIWGFTAVLGALISLAAVPLVWYRMSMASVFILFFIWIKRIPFKVPLKILIGFIFAGLIITLHWLTFFKAIKVSNISVTLALGIIFKVEGNYIQGILFALSSAFLSALFSVINSKYAKLYNPSVVSFYEILSGVVFLSVYFLFIGDFDSAFFQLSFNDWMYLALLSSICTAYAFIASVKVMKFLSPYTVMLTINLEPIYGIILAVIVFHDKEKMSIEFYIGVLIILSTVIMNGIIKYYKK